MLVWKLLWEALERFLHQDLVRLAWAAAGPFMTTFCASLKRLGRKILVKVLYMSLWEAHVEILVTCCQSPLHDLVQVLMRNSWRCPGEILSVSLHDPVQILVRRPFGDPVEILLQRSCVEILKILSIGACMKVLLGCSCGILVWKSCELLDKKIFYIYLHIYLCCLSTSLSICLSIYLSVCLYLCRRSCCCSCDHA